MTSSLHVSSHASTSTSVRSTSALDTSSDTSASHVSSVASSAPRHLADRWLGPTRPGLHGSDPLALTVDFDPGQLTLTFTLTFDQKSKFSIGTILLSFSRRFQFRTPFLHLKLQNWSIGTFFIVVSSKAFFTTSSKDLLTLIQPQAFIPLSLKEGIRDIY